MDLHRSHLCTLLGLGFTSSFSIYRRRALFVLVVLDFWVMERQTNNLEETAQMAAECLAGLEPSQQATVLALRGDLGAGKTTFTQALARELGISENVTSPTFVIMKIYDLENQPADRSGKSFTRLIHIDAYRFDTPDELDGLNFSDFLKDPKNLIILEWPEKVAGKLPAGTIFIDFRFISDTVREISYA